MHVVVTKQPDTRFHLTRQPHGDVFDGELDRGDVVTISDDIALEARWDTRYGQEVIWFSWTDFFDHNQPGGALEHGIRHTVEVPAGTGREDGPFYVQVSA